MGPRFQNRALPPIPVVIVVALFPGRGKGLADRLRSRYLRPRTAQASGRGKADRFAIRPVIDGCARIEHEICVRIVVVYDPWLNHIARIKPGRVIGYGKDRSAGGLYPEVFSVSLGNYRRGCGQRQNERKKLLPHGSFSLASANESWRTRQASG